MSVSQVTLFPEHMMKSDRLHPDFDSEKGQEFTWNFSGWIRRITKGSSAHRIIYAALTPIQNKPRIQHILKKRIYLFFTLFKIKSQKQWQGMDFSNYQVSCLLLPKAKYHTILSFSNPLQSFFHYFALSHKKIKCKIPVSKKTKFYTSTFSFLCRQLKRFS